MQLIELRRNESNYLISDINHMYTLQRKRKDDGSFFLVLNLVDQEKLENQLFNKTK